MGQGTFKTTRIQLKAKRKNYSCFCWALLGSLPLLPTLLVALVVGFQDSSVEWIVPKMSWAIVEATSWSAPSVTAPTPSAPVRDLKSFVAHERAIALSTSRNNMRENSGGCVSYPELLGIEDLPTEHFHRYAVANCAAAGSLEGARENLRLQLSDIPEPVRERMLQRVLVPGISQKNSIQDATSQLTSDGQAQSYLAFWSTNYNAHSMDRQYETCVIVAGVTIKVAEMVAEYKHETKKVIVGSEPCHCGIFYCEVCPVMDTQTTMTPVFKRHSLSLKQQNDLHSLMTLHALNAAESMLATHNNDSSATASSSSQPDYTLPGSSHQEAEMQQLSWKKPEMAFVGHT